MQVKDVELYHIHKNEFYPEKWKVGGKIQFSKQEYNSLFGFYMNHTVTKNNSNISVETKMREYTMLIRELVFEEIREKEFPTLPSRRHCVWLCDGDSLPLWLNTLNENVSVYKVRATGNLHICYAGALEDNRINYRLLVDVARKYWNGDIVGNPLEKEYILEGEIEIVEKIK